MKLSVFIAAIVLVHAASGFDFNFDFKKIAKQFQNPQENDKVYNDVKQRAEQFIEMLKANQEQYQEMANQALATVNQMMEKVFEVDEYGKMSNETEAMILQFIDRANATFYDMIEKARERLPEPEVEDRIKELEEARDQFIAKMKEFRKYVQENLTTREGREKFMEKVKEQIKAYLKGFEEYKDAPVSMYKGLVDTITEELKKLRKNKQMQMPENLQETIQQGLSTFAEKFSHVTKMIRGAIKENKGGERVNMMRKKLMKRLEKTRK